MDEALNIGFFVLHTSWIFFICAGWIWRRTRRWHLAAIALTALSWFGLGIWYGWGYCPFTDWHWQARERLGYRDPESYTQLLLAEFTGLDVTRAWADGVTVTVFAIAMVLSVALNVRDRRSLSRPAA
jgi:hypothetical protein